MDVERSFVSSSVFDGWICLATLQRSHAIPNVAMGDLCLARPDSVVPLLGAWIWEHFHHLPHNLLKVPGVPPWTLQAQVHQTRQILLGPQKVGNRGAKQMVYTGRPAHRS